MLGYSIDEMFGKPVFAFMDAEADELRTEDAVGQFVNLQPLAGAYPVQRCDVSSHGPSLGKLYVRVHARYRG